MSRDDRDASTPHPVVFYRSAGGDQRIQVLFRKESFWMPQKAIAELFGVQAPAISKHLANIFESGELERGATVSNLEMVRQEGTRRVTRNVEHYNLDAIIAVGYRVNSYQATQFRIWATRTLREFVGGFTEEGGGGAGIDGIASARIAAAASRGDVGFEGVWRGLHFRRAAERGRLRRPRDRASGPRGPAGRR